MNTVGEGDVTTSQSDAIEIRDVPQSTLLLHKLTLDPVFRRMRVDHHTARSRKLCNLRQQLARATDRKPRRETVANTTTRSSMPLVEECERLFDRGRGL